MKLATTFALAIILGRRPVRDAQTALHGVITAWESDRRRAQNRRLPVTHDQIALQLCERWQKSQRNRVTLDEIAAFMSGVKAVMAPYEKSDRDNLGRRVDAAPMPEALKDTIATCYGLLWEVETDNDRIHRARRGLLSWLTKEEQARGIENARGVALMVGLQAAPPSRSKEES